MIYISYISYDVFIFLRVLMQTKDIFYVSLCKPYHCHSHLSLNVPPRPQQPPRLYIQYKCAVIHAARINMINKERILLLYINILNIIYIQITYFYYTYFIKFIYSFLTI